MNNITSLKKGKIRFAFLLTSTIKPNITVFSKRKDPKIRERDYYGVLSTLAKTNHPIVFCDSSDYSLENMKEVLSSRPSGTYEVLQFDGSVFPPHLGKGYGELQIIRYALEHSTLLKECDFIIKITGRYSVENINQILDAIRVDSSTLIIADYNSSSRYTYSGLFIARPSFFSDHLFSFQEFLNDSEKRFFEIAFHRAIQKAVSEGGGVLQFPIKPIITGYSGTWDVKMAKGDYRAIEMSFAKIQIITLAYARVLRSKIKAFFR